MTFLINRFSRLISLPTSAIFVSETSGITAILKYRSVNPIYIYYYYYLFPTDEIICGTLLEKWGQTHKRHPPVDPFTWTSKGRTTS